MELTLHNESATPMPAGLGWHPYFPRTPRTRVTARVGAIWLTDDSRTTQPTGIMRVTLDRVATDSESVTALVRDRLAVEPISVSVDDVDSHRRWAGDIEETQGTKWPSAFRRACARSNRTCA